MFLFIYPKYFDKIFVLLIKGMLDPLWYGLILFRNLTNQAQPINVQLLVDNQQRRKYGVLYHESFLIPSIIIDFCSSRLDTFAFMTTTVSSLKISLFVS